MLIHSIFRSIGGEVSYPNQGLPSTFIRTQGCSAKCSWCDTPESQLFDSSKEMPIEKIVDEVLNMKIPHVTITGGEPLEQNKRELNNLIGCLKANGVKTICIETNGFRPIIANHSDWVSSYIVDFKPLSSKCTGSFVLSNLDKMSTEDWLKCPVMNRKDFDFFLKFYKTQCLSKGVFRVAVSAVHPLSPNQLWKWMKKSHIWDVSLNVQIHKLINVQ